MPIPKIGPPVGAHLGRVGFIQDRAEVRFLDAARLRGCYLAATLAANFQRRLDQHKIQHTRRFTLLAALRIVEASLPAPDAPEGLLLAYPKPQPPQPGWSFSFS
jgi:hypothetical protein